MSTVKTPNYALTEAFTYYPNGWGGEGRTLPEGSWVKPIDDKYVPAHVKDDKRWDDYNPETETFAYTRFGIIAVPKRIVVER